MNKSDTSPPREVRLPAVAGRFYPADAAALRDLGLKPSESGRSDGPSGTNPNDPRAAFDALFKK